MRGNTSSHPTLTVPLPRPMHNLTKIRIYRVLLYLSYLPALIFVWPLARWRKKNHGRLFFFFDRYAMGGSQRVHLDILKSVADVPKQIYFTRKSPDATLRHEFFQQPNADVRDIHRWCENLLLRLFTVHYYAFYLNRHKGAHVFSSTSTFFYDMLPFLSRRVVKTELLHMFNYGKKGMEFFGLANYRFLDHRVILDTLTQQNLAEQYRAHSVPAAYLNRVRYIETAVTVPAVFPQKNSDEKLQVLYAGRGGAQKRVWIINKIAERCMDAQLPIAFHFAGNMQEELSGKVKNAATLYGNVASPAEMEALFRMADVLLMTSAFEGFPMAIKEAMAQGCVPVVTALEGNKNHLKHGVNAVLLQQVTDEAALEEEGFARLQELTEDRARLAQLSHAAYEYARHHFDRERFEEAYRKLLL